MCVNGRVSCVNVLGVNGLVTCVRGPPISCDNGLVSYVNGPASRVSTLMSCRRRVAGSGRRTSATGRRRSR